MSTDTTPVPAPVAAKPIDHTRGELLATIAEERAAVAEWRNGDVSVAPGDRYWAAVLDLVSTWGRCPRIPDSLLPLVRTINDLGEAMRDHVIRYQWDFRSAIPIPPSETGGPLHFGDAIEERMKGVTKPRPALESVRELLEQEVEPWQICKMYKLVDEYGNPDIDKVLREKRSPGSESFTPPEVTETINRSEFDVFIDELATTAKVLAMIYEDPEHLSPLLSLDKKLRRKVAEERWTGSSRHEDFWNRFDK